VWSISSCFSIFSKNLTMKTSLLLLSVFVMIVLSSCGTKEENDNKGKENSSEVKKLVSNQNDSKSELKYDEVTIGKQVWMIENLNVDKFRNGDPIPHAKTKEEWEKAGEEGKPAWCYYDNDPANGKKYGKLYNWYAVNDSRGLAPDGYHIPSHAEWEKLTDFLGGNSVAGAKMKSKSGWSSYTTGGSKTCPNCKEWNDEYRRKVPCHTCKDTRSVPAYCGNGTNTSGFSGLPGSNRKSNGAFNYIGGYGSFDLSTGEFLHLGKGGNWWSSTEYPPFNAWGRFLDCSSGDVLRSVHDKRVGLSVRCLRD